MKNLEIYHSPYTKIWYALDEYGFALWQSKYPSSVRTFRHLYKAYVTVPTGEDSIMKKIQELK